MPSTLGQFRAPDLVGLYQREGSEAADFVQLTVVQFASLNLKS
jgi:hypothetical protein